MFSNVYGYEGVRKAIRLMKNEIVQDGWNLGIGSLGDLEPSLVSSTRCDLCGLELVLMGFRS